MAPRRRPVARDTKDRLASWCDDLVPGVRVDIDEWVGADPRQPLHVVVVSFPQLDWPPVVLQLKVDEVQRIDLVQALEVSETRSTMSSNADTVRSTQGLAQTR